MVVALEAYFSAQKALREKSAGKLAQALGAKPIAMKQGDWFRILNNVVEEMAVASGTLPPEVFYLPQDKSINAFVLGGAERSVALVVSQGLIKYLSRDEQQAVIAHEFGHIVNEDVFLYSQLSAVLAGFYALSQLGQGGIGVSAGREFFWRGIREPSFLVKALSSAGGILFYIGQWIQAAFSREREWMADARAVQFTRHSESLIMALKKALALQVLEMRPFEMPDTQAHFLFIRYFTQTMRFATHPALSDRIMRYGGQIDQKEIDALAFDIRTKRLYSGADKPIALNRQAFTANLLYPILIIVQKQREAPNFSQRLSEEERVALLLAFFAYHSGFNEFELAQLSIELPIPMTMLTQGFIKIEKIDPIAQIPCYFNLLQNTPKAELAKL
ncbi:Protease HtpX homolog [Suttonella ornithocola]|uniref:Protease HtpX homolog n=1 Tax=Suttonella ornithocola TaxID=279832 RepID=A0A380MSN2_9GAMM|nr:Protease HtpX homolog [Suttonella ornithocola]